MEDMGSREFGCSKELKCVCKRLVQEFGQNNRNRIHEAIKDIEFQEEFMQILEYTLLQSETVGFASQNSLFYHAKQCLLQDTE